MNKQVLVPIFVFILMTGTALACVTPTTNLILNSPSPIYFCSGTYQATYIQIVNGTTVYFNNTIIDNSANPNDYYHAFIMEDGATLDCQGGSIIGNLTGVDFYAQGIRINGSNIIVNNCSFSNNWYHIIQHATEENKTNLHLSNLILGETQPGNGILLQGADNSILENIQSNSPTNAVSLTGSNYSINNIDGFSGGMLGGPNRGFDGEMYYSDFLYPDPDPNDALGYGLSIVNPTQNHPFIFIANNTFNNLNIEKVVEWGSPGNWTAYSPDGVHVVDNTIYGDISDNLDYPWNGGSEDHVTWCFDNVGNNYYGDYYGEDNNWATCCINPTNDTLYDSSYQNPVVFCGGEHNVHDINIDNNMDLKFIKSGVTLYTSLPSTEFDFHRIVLLNENSTINCGNDGWLECRGDAMNITDWETEGISVQNYAKNIEINSCNINNCPTGLHIPDVEGSGAIVRNTYINSQDAVQLRSDSALYQNLQITGVNPNDANDLVRVDVAGIDVTLNSVDVTGMIRLGLADDPSLYFSGTLKNSNDNLVFAVIGDYGTSWDSTWINRSGSEYYVNITGNNFYGVLWIDGETNGNQYVYGNTGYLEDMSNYYNGAYNYSDTTEYVNYCVNGIGNTWTNYWGTDIYLGTCRPIPVAAYLMKNEYVSGGYLLPALNTTSDNLSMVDISTGLTNDSAFGFNGATSNLISSTDNMPIANSTEWSVCMRYKSNSSNLQRVVSQQGVFAPHLNAIPGTFSLLMSDYDFAWDKFYDVTGVWTSDVWREDCITKDTTSGYAGFKFYSNGLQIPFIINTDDASGIDTAFPSGTGALWYIGGNDQDQWFSGEISEVCMYNEALSSTEVARLATKSQCGFAPANDITIEPPSCVYLMSDMVYTGDIVVCPGEHNVKNVMIGTNTHMTFEPGVTVTSYSTGSDNEPTISFTGNNATLDCNSGTVTGWYDGDGSPFDTGADGEGTTGVRFDTATYDNTIQNCNVNHAKFGIFTWFDTYNAKFINITLSDGMYSIMHGIGDNGYAKNIQMNSPTDNWFLIGRNATILESSISSINVGRDAPANNEDGSWGSLRAYNNTMNFGLYRISDDGLLDLRDNIIDVLYIYIYDPEYLTNGLIASNIINRVEDYMDYDIGTINWCDTSTKSGNRYSDAYYPMVNGDSNLGTCNCDYINSGWTCTLTHDIILNNTEYTNTNIQTNAPDITLNCNGTKFNGLENNNSQYVTFMKINNNKVELNGCTFDGFSRIANINSNDITFESITDLNHRKQCTDPGAGNCQDNTPGQFFTVGDISTQGRNVTINNSYIEGDVHLEISGKPSVTTLWNGDYCADSSDQYVPNSDMCNDWDYVTNGATEPECAPGMWNANLSRCEDSRFRYAGGNCVYSGCSGNQYYFDGYNYWYDCDISDVAPLNFVMENTIINRVNGTIVYGVQSWDGRANRYFDHYLFPYAYVGKGVTLKNNTWYWAEDTSFEDPIDGYISEQQSLVARVAGIEDVEIIGNKIYGGKASISLDGEFNDWAFPTRKDCPTKGVLMRDNYAEPTERPLHGLFSSSRYEDAIIENNIQDNKKLLANEKYTVSHRTEDTFTIHNGAGAWEEENMTNGGNITVRNNRILNLDSEWSGYLGWWGQPFRKGIFIYNNYFNGTNNNVFSINEGINRNFTLSYSIAVSGNDYEVEFYNNTIENGNIKLIGHNPQLDWCKGGIGNNMDMIWVQTVYDIVGMNDNNWSFNPACSVIEVPNGMYIYSGEGVETNLHLNGNGVEIRGDNTATTGIKVLPNWDDTNSSLTGEIKGLKVRGYQESLVFASYDTGGELVGAKNITFRDSDVDKPYYDYGVGWNTVRTNKFQNLTVPAPLFNYIESPASSDNVNQELTYSVSTIAQIDNCVLNLNGVPFNTKTGFLVNEKTSEFTIPIPGLALRSHAWELLCTDVFGNEVVMDGAFDIYKKAGGGFFPPPVVPKEAEVAKTPIDSIQTAFDTVKQTLEEVFKKSDSGPITPNGDKLVPIGAIIGVVIVGIILFNKGGR